MTCVCMVCVCMTCVCVHDVCVCMACVCMACVCMTETRTVVARETMQEADCARGGGREV
jgi:hypothetical protein